MNESLLFNRPRNPTLCPWGKAYKAPGLKGHITHILPVVGLNEDTRLSLWPNVKFSPRSCCSEVRSQVSFPWKTLDRTTRPPKRMRTWLFPIMVAPSTFFRSWLWLLSTGAQWAPSSQYSIATSWSNFRRGRRHIFSSGLLRNVTFSSSCRENPYSTGYGHRLLGSLVAWGEPFLLTFEKIA